VEISMNAIRFARQNDLTISDYHDLMMDNIDEVTDKRLVSLREIEKDKIIIAKAYNNLAIKEQGQEVWQVVPNLRRNLDCVQQFTHMVNQNIVLYYFTL
jgi:hypothetical protein